MQANQTVQTRERLQFDSGRDVWKVQKADLRDIDALMARFSVPELQRDAVNQGGIVLVGPKDYIIEFQPDSSAPSLSVLPLPAGISKQSRRPPLHTGVISSGSLSGKLGVSISQSQWEGRPAVEVVVSGPVVTNRYVADPQLGYRFRQVTVKDDHDRRIREIMASDYRQVDGVWYPFRWEDRTFNQGSDQASTQEIIQVEAASFKPPPADTFLLVIPAGTQVCNAVGAYRSIFTLRTDRIIDLESAPELKPFERPQTLPAP
jgi:hypothetical protein